MLATISLFLFSCSDSGCIDADDFGEYETQTITVTSNAQQENCSYNSTLELTDSEQGSGIKDCLATGSTTVTNEDGDSMDSTSGCSGFTDVAFQYICINSCIQSCLSSVGSTDSASAEPSWNSTSKKGSGQNSGVTIRPGSQIMVRAIGNVMLGNAVSYPDVYLKANGTLPYTYNSSWQNSFFDVRSGQSLTLTFSGLVYTGTNDTDPLGQTSTSSDLYNLARKLVVYTIPHPDGYGGVNTTETSEKLSAKTVPLQHDPQAWQCSYSGSDLTEATCTNSSYVSLGYSNVDDSLTDAAFPISSKVKTSGLTEYGGIVRWTDDGLKAGDYDPFTASSVTCNSSGTCTNIGNVSVSEGKLIGDISSGSVTVENTSNDAYAISFRSLTGDTSCDSDTSTDNMLAVTVTDSSDSTLYTFQDNISISNSSWTSSAINLEAGHKLVFSQKANFKYGGSGINCGRVIGMRFLKYHDLTMENSGFVRFSILGGAGGSCTIKGRIINPDGSHTDFDGSDSADFYEYGTYSSSSGDPLASLSVTVSPNGSPSWSPSTSSSTSQVFVRKGQKIRFHPDSWSSTWATSNSLTRTCGIGMAMSVSPRPALLCRGTTSEPVYSTTCSPQVGTDGVLLGCQAVSSTCSDSTSSNYCSYSDCLDSISCTETGTADNNYTRTCLFSNGTSTPSQADDSTCTTALSGLTSSQQTTVQSQCESCASAMLAAGNQSALVDVSGISQCYDLENYTGKVSNIPSTLSSIDDVTDFLDGSYAKGAVKLSGFNGTYGNIAAFSDSGTTSTGDKSVYNVSSSYIVSADSRLRLLLLDGTTFADPTTGAWTAYSDNTSPTTSYNGSNGIKVGFSGSLDFSNGKWMQVRLCQESSNDDDNMSYDCKSVDTPTDFAASNSQPTIINITAPTTDSLVGADPDLTTGNSNYNFDSSGNLYRTTSGTVTGDCTLATHGYQNALGSTFYCHSYEYYSADDLADKSDSEQDDIDDKVERLRLTFKILDPEVGDCDLSVSGTNDGIQMSNPYYDSDTTSNIGAICGTSGSTADTPGDGSDDYPGTCEKQYYCANKYSNNSGEYYVNVKVKSDQNGTISSIISAVITPVIEVMDGKLDDPDTDEDESTVGQAERIYKLLITDSRYKAILTVSLVIMFTFYGVGYLLGVSELNHSEIFGRILKIGFIYLMVGETGWDWFNMFFVAFFKEGTDYLSFMMASSFDDSPDITSAIASGDLYDKSVLFSSVDNVFNLFFSSAVQKKLSALLFASIFGWAYLLIIWWSFLHYVYAVGNAILLYLTAQVFISILFVIGPIFFIFLIFNQTKEMFDNWIKHLIGFSLQQIFLLITLAFFNMLMYEVIKMSLGFKVCWDEVWVMNLGITRISLMSFWTIASLPPRTNANSQVGNIGNPEGIPSIFTILFIWVIASLMEQFIGFMTDLAVSISGGLKASEMGAGVKGAISNFNNSFVQPAMNKAWDKTAGRALDYADDKIFDSGKTADKRREDADKKLASDNANKSSMSEAGKEAASKFRKENASLSDIEKAKGAAEAAEKAMRKKAEDLGLNEKETDRLMNDKGIKTGGSTTIMGALNNARKSRGTANMSLAEQAAATSGKMSASEAKEAKKGMTAEKRAEFDAKQLSGEIGVERSSLEAAADFVTGKTTSKNIASAGSAIKSGIGSAANMAVSSAIKAVTGQDINVGQMLGEISGTNKNYAEAEEQLVKEGDIDKMAKGAGWSRSAIDEEKIHKRMRENEAKKKLLEPTEAPNLDTAAALALDTEHMNEMDKIEDMDISPVEKSARKMAQRASTLAKKVIPKGMTKYRADAASKVKPSTEILENNINKLDAENDKEIAALEESRGEAMSVVKGASGQKVKASQKKIDELRAKHGELKKKAKSQKGDEKKATLKEADKTFAKLRQEERELAGSDELKEFQQATIAVHQIDAQISNKESVKDQYAAMRDNIKTAKEIKANAAAITSGMGVDSKKDSRSFEHQKMAEKNPELMAKAGKAQDAIVADFERSGDLEYARSGLSQYNEAINSGDIKKVEGFVDDYYRPTEQERKAELVENDFDNSRSVQDFDKFVKKYG